MTTLLTRKQAAQIIGVSLRTLDRWHRVGSLKAVRVGNAKRYHSAKIEAKGKP